MFAQFTLISLRHSIVCGIQDFCLRCVDVVSTVAQKGHTLQTKSQHASNKKSAHFKQKLACCKQKSENDCVRMSAVSYRRLMYVVSSCTSVYDTKRLSTMAHIRRPASVTAKLTFSRQNILSHGKPYFLMAKLSFSPQNFATYR